MICNFICWQLLANLHELIEQKGEAGKVIESKLQSMSDDLHSVLLQHIQVRNKKKKKHCACGDISVVS